MAKCGTCGSSGDLMGASNYRAWIQPCGPGKNNPKFPAMCEDGAGGVAWTNLEITNLVHNQKGTPTTEYRRSFRNPCNVVAKKIVRGQPDNNTVDIQMDRVCGGVDAARMQDQKFNLYLQHVCCCGSSTSFPLGWSGAIDVIEGVDFSGYTMPGLTDTGNDQESVLRIQLNGVTFDDFYSITEMDVSEVGASGGMTVGTRVSDAKFYIPEGGCNKQGCNSCGKSYYAVADDGFLIYSYEGGTLQEQQLAALVGGGLGSQFVEYIGNRIFITYSQGGGDDGFLTATLDNNGAPGTFSDVIVGSTVAGTADIAWAGILNAGDKLLAFGSRSTTNESIIVEISESGAFEIVYESDAVTPSLRGMARCGSQIVAVGNGGAILKKSKCGNNYAPITSPTANDVTAVDIRVEDEIWIGTNAGEVFCTTDCGENWTDVSAQFGGTGIRDILWLNESVGYLLDTIGFNSMIWSTWDGGHSWTMEDPRVGTQPDTAQLTGIDVPCCDNRNVSANQIIGAGLAAANGVLYLGVSAAC